MERRTKDGMTAELEDFAWKGREEKPWQAHKLWLATTQGNFLCDNILKSN